MSVASMATESPRTAACREANAYRVAGGLASADAALTTPACLAPGRLTARRGTQIRRKERKSMSTYDEPARGRTSLECPVCRELSRLKGPHRRFRCPNGHSFPIEALLALKERRLETLGWTLTALQGHPDLRARPLAGCQAEGKK